MHEMSVNIVVFDSSLIPKQSANARGSPEDTYAVNTHQTSQMHAAVSSSLNALHAASPHITAPDCRRNSVPGLWYGCQCHENFLADGKQNAM